MIIHSEQEMLKHGEQFVGRVLPPQFSPPCLANVSVRQESPCDESHPSMSATVIEILGDVGAGKTTFVRGLAKGLGIKESITSPSFTISKTYALPSGGNLIHYDFYRLPEPGLMAEDLTENLANPDNIIVIEWGESIKDFLPENHHVVAISYQDDSTREVIES